MKTHLFAVLFVALFAMCCFAGEPPMVVQSDCPSGTCLKQILPMQGLLLTHQRSPSDRLVSDLPVSDLPVSDVVVPVAPEPATVVQPTCVPVDQCTRYVKSKCYPRPFAKLRRCR